MENVKELKQKLHSDRLAKIYSRVERGNRDFSPDYITETMAPFHPSQIGDYFFAVTKENPFDEYNLCKEIDLQETIPFFNSILLYRILKLLYDRPDILSAFFPINPTSTQAAGPIDWGYTILIIEELYAEIRSIHNNTRFKLRFWMRSALKDCDQRKLYGAKMDEFLTAFADCLEKNAHLFNEETELDDAIYSGLANIFAQKYKSAEKLFSLANDLDLLPQRKDLRWEESLGVSTSGSLYLSSAVLFIIALESLINTIYHLRLKQAYRLEAYERSTIRADLDLRIVTAHLFCEGFDMQIVTPYTELWDRLLKIRKFRNDIVHGNITPDSYSYALPEDMFIFFYNGLTDFRGRKAEVKYKKKYPTTMAQINKSVVSEIKETVDLIVQAIVEAAEHENKKWLKSWIWEALIPNFGQQKDVQPPQPEND